MKTDVVSPFLDPIVLSTGPMRCFVMHVKNLMHSAQAHEEDESLQPTDSATQVHRELLMFARANCGSSLNPYEVITEVCLRETTAGVETDEDPVEDVILRPLRLIQLILFPIPFVWFRW